MNILLNPLFFFFLTIFVNVFSIKLFQAINDNICGLQIYINNLKKY